MHFGKERREGLEWRVRVGHEPAVDAEVGALGDQVAGVTELDMDGTAAGAGLREVREVGLRVGDHQVAVEVEGCMRAY